MDFEVVILLVGTSRMWRILWKSCCLLYVLFEAHCYLLWRITLVVGIWVTILLLSQSVITLLVEAQSGLFVWFLRIVENSLLHWQMEDVWLIMCTSGLAHIVHTTQACTENMQFLYCHSRGSSLNLPPPPPPRPPQCINFILHNFWISLIKKHLEYFSRYWWQNLDLFSACKEVQVSS
jgi:hypothetical protein